MAELMSGRSAEDFAVLVVDEVGMRVMNSVIRMFDLSEAGVTTVENLELARRPLPELDAIYFISPSPGSVELLLKDFEDAKNPMYKNVYIFFTSTLGSLELSHMKSSPIVSRVRGLKDLNIEFLVTESNVFHLDARRAFRNLFAPGSSPLEEQHNVARQLATVFLTIGEMPSIRYHRNHKTAGSIANIVSDKLSSYVSNPNVKFPTSQSSNQPLLLIVDRSIDGLAPCLHEFTYQAMVYDLLNVDLKSDKYAYKTQDGKGQDLNRTVVLNEDDPIWPQMRHMHIAEAIDWVVKEFNSFIKTNKAANISKGEKARDVKDITEAVKQLPQYREIIAKYSLHLTMTKEAMALFNKTNLEEIGMLEQDMVMGETASGEPVKNVFARLTAVLHNPEVSPLDKLRLIVIYTLSQEGVDESSRRKLLSVAGLTRDPTDGEVVRSLEDIGISINSGKKSRNIFKKDKKKRKTKPDEVSYDLSRYTPEIKDICQQLLENKLSRDDYPFVKEPVGGGAASASSGQSARSRPVGNWANKRERKGESEGENLSGSRVFVFIVGGMTHSEMRVAYELQKAFKREVIIGSTEVITSGRFVEQLRSLRGPERALGDY
eukprot:CAMPEP_0113893618 /NCGR_PEP_ID=MMETSP0780_2-20120614/16206_1 /TAXON_ID=652834 /ORGANISM="Palpitomonas bilix" /LENGTH=601 /DNA_ID=CAMNT_0000883955 /DNA_START=79 /DNA_END=1884 /DNA_ORIENTATION=- /assembly_acc=CAM_ASM_000599